MRERPKPDIGTFRIIKTDSVCVPFLPRFAHLTAQPHHPIPSHSSCSRPLMRDRRRRRLLRSAVRAPVGPVKQDWRKAVCTTTASIAGSKQYQSRLAATSTNYAGVLPLGLDRYSSPCAELLFLFRSISLFGVLTSYVRHMLTSSSTTRHRKSHQPHRIALLCFLPQLSSLLDEHILSPDRATPLLFREITLCTYQHERLTTTQRFGCTARSSCHTSSGKWLLWCYEEAEEGCA